MRRDFDTDQSADTEGIAVIKKVQRKIREHVRDAYPLECCGLLFGRAGKTGPLMIEDSVRTENVSEKKETHFQIAPLEMFRHERKQAERGFELLGFYHSHPDQPAVPSEEADRFGYGWRARRDPCLDERARHGHGEGTWHGRRNRLIHGERVCAEE